MIFMLLVCSVLLNITEANEFITFCLNTESHVQRVSMCLDTPETMQ